MSETLRRELETVHTGDPSAMCEKALGLLSERFDAPLAWFFQVVEVDGEWWYTSCQAGGTRVSREIVAEYAERPRFDAPWDPEEPEPEHVNRFVNVGETYDRGELASAEVQKKVYRDRGISDPARAMFYDGDRFVGWFGLMRRGVGPAFDRSEVEQLNRLRDEIRSVACGLEAVRARRAGESSLYALFDPGGALDYATETACEWLDRSRRDAIASWIRRFESRDAIPSIRTLEGAELRLIRLDGEDGVRYLSSIDRAVLPRLDPLHRLTERQREVAEFAAVGATNDEIARTLEISRSTVKFHLKRVYGSLGVDDRIELAEVVGS